MTSRTTSWAISSKPVAVEWWCRRRVAPTATITTNPAGQSARCGAAATTGTWSRAAGAEHRSRHHNPGRTADSAAEAQSRCGRTSNGFDRGALRGGGGPIQCAWRTSRCDNPAMGQRDAAQAAQLIRTLCEVRDKMISQMTWLEKNDRQSDAAALRRDVNEAQAHITRLHRRYLGGEVQASQPVRQAR
jgi:hypothetical protein